MISFFHEQHFENQERSKAQIWMHLNSLSTPQDLENEEKMTKAKEHYYFEE